MDELITTVIAISMASERLVEIIKNAISPLSQARSDAKEEGYRQACLHLITFATCIGTAIFANAQGMPLPQLNGHPVNAFVLGLLAVGGTPFWNSVLSYLAKVKDIKAATAYTAKQNAGLLAPKADKKPAVADGQVGQAGMAPAGQPA